MTFIQAIKSGFKNYVNFQGRALRSEYWWWALFQFLAIIVSYALMMAGKGSVLSGIGGLLYFVVALGLLLPSLAVSVRRLHDTDHSGWWLFISFVPLVGGILLLVWTIMKGTNGANKYGSDPLASDVVATFD